MTSGFKRNQRPATNHSNDNLMPPHVQQTEDSTKHRVWRQFQTSKLNLLPVPRCCKITYN